MTRTKSELDREDRLMAQAAGSLSDADLVWLLDRIVTNYEEPQSFFSGHNEFAALVREAARRLSR